MPDTKMRVMVWVLGLAMTLALVACEADDSPTTTSPGESDTVEEPIGS